MSFRDVVGHADALRVLGGAMKRGRLASAYLFAGEHGVGKRFTAVNFAKALNCLQPIERDGIGDACEECASCLKFNSGSHPDFMLVEPDGGVIKVDQIRAVEEALSLKSHEARVRVVIVDEAECMNISAANAFLKTLEEPAGGSMIILVSSAPDMLPDTIRSRCSRVPFRPLSVGEAAEVIRTGAKGKKAQDVHSLAVLSMGRPGLALGEDLLKERKRFLGALEKMLQEESKPTWKDRQEMQRWFDMALMFVRDLAVMRLRGGAGGLMVVDPEGDAPTVPGGALEKILDCYTRLLEIRRGLLFNPNKGITWNYAGGIMGGLLLNG